jgi:hypothetical protein
MMISFSFQYVLKVARLGRAQAQGDEDPPKYPRFIAERKQIRTVSSA